MSYLNGQTSITLSNYWVLSFFIALLLDVLVFCPIMALLAHIPAFQSFLVWKGMIYDSEVCHWAYKHQKKVL